MESTGLVLRGYLWPSRIESQLPLRRFLPLGSPKSFHSLALRLTPGGTHTFRLFLGATASGVSAGRLLRIAGPWRASIAWFSLSRRQ
jgi:hypothetical protein